MRVDLIARLVSPCAAVLLTALGSSLLSVFLCLLAWRVFLHAGAIADENTITNILEWPVVPFLYAVAGLLGLAAANQMTVVFEHWRTLASIRSAQETRSRAIPVVAVALYGAAFLLLAIGALDFASLADLAVANAGLTVVIAFLAIWAFLFPLVPLGCVLGLIGLAGAALFVAPGPALDIFAQEPTGSVTNSLVAVLPLFLMMGSFAAVADLADDIYALAHALLSGFRGGLALATIGGCAGFGSVTGSSLATTATIGRVALPEMRRRGYANRLATSSVAAGGTLGALVPPSGAILV